MCSEVFGVAELRHTSCHLSAVSRVPQSFKSARLVMRADGKRWDSSISPPTHTEGDGLSGDKAPGCTFLCQHAWKSECVCACVRTLVCETSSNHTKLLLTLHLPLSWSYCIFIRVLSHSLLPPLSLSFFICTPPLPPCTSVLVFPLRLSKFDAEPSVNPSNVAPQSFFGFLHLTQVDALSRCWLPLWLQLRNISVLIDSYYTCVSVWECVYRWVSCISVYVRTGLKI